MKGAESERIHIITGDITEMKVDAVVNAANSGLMGGGGVDGAIHRRGGPAILEACKEIRKNSYPDGLPAGKAVITTGGRLAAAHVIHTVGPVWNGGQAKEPEILENAYRNSLILAARNNIAGVAFPAISTGIYGYPQEKAAAVAFKTVREFLRQNELPREVFFVFFTGPDATAFRQAIAAQTETEGN